jgi:hypothetical protein
MSHLSILIHKISFYVRFADMESLVWDPHRWLEGWMKTERFRRPFSYRRCLGVLNLCNIQVHKRIIEFVRQEGKIQITCVPEMDPLPSTIRSFHNLGWEACHPGSALALVLTLCSDRATNASFNKFLWEPIPSAKLRSSKPSWVQSRINYPVGFFTHHTQACYHQQCTSLA